MYAKTFTLVTEIDTAANGGDITNLLVPGTGMFLPVHAVLTDPARRVQFRDDLRTLTENLIDRHKTGGGPSNPGCSGDGPRANPSNPTDRLRPQHQELRDDPQRKPAVRRPAVGRPGHGPDILLERAWDDTADRWNEDLTNFAPADVAPDSDWWTHDEADQLLAALDLTDGFAHADQLATSSQKFLDVYVDRAPSSPSGRRSPGCCEPARSRTTASRSSARTCCTTSSTRCVLYLHGRQMDGLPGAAPLRPARGRRH